MRKAIRRNLSLVRLMVILAGIAWVLVVIAERADDYNFNTLLGVIELSTLENTAKAIAVLVDDGFHPTLRAAYTSALQEQAYIVAAVAAADLAGLRAQHDRLGQAPGATLRSISDVIADRIGIARDSPLVVGLGAGATCVPAWIRAPRDVLLAVVAVDFCPTTSGNAATCPAPGATADSAPLIDWYAFKHGTGEPRCSNLKTLSALEHTADAKVTTIAHGSAAAVPDEFSALIQWLDPAVDDEDQTQASVPGISIVEQHSGDGRNVVIFLSGDGGWAALDRGVTTELQRSGISTIGWNSLSYFWSARTPEKLAADLATVIDTYTSKWGSTTFVVAGYSLGADVLPFAINRLDAKTRAKLAAVVLLAPGARTAFEFHLTEWLGHVASTNSAVTPEIARIAAPPPVFCVTGTADTEVVCPKLSPPSRKFEKPGDHHFANDYAGLADIIRTAFGSALVTRE